MQGPTTDEAPTNGLTKTTHADERLLLASRTDTQMPMCANDVGLPSALRSRLQVRGDSNYASRHGWIRAAAR